MLWPLTDTVALTGDISSAGHSAPTRHHHHHYFPCTFVFTVHNKWVMLHSTSLHIINTGNKSPLSLLGPTQHTPDPPLLTTRLTRVTQLTVSLFHPQTLSNQSLHKYKNFQCFKALIKQLCQRAQLWMSSV